MQCEHFRLSWRYAYQMHKLAKALLSFSLNALKAERQCYSEREHAVREFYVHLALCCRLP